MKFLISLLAAVSLIVTGVTALKVNAQDILNSPSSYDFGTLDTSLSYQTGLNFTVQNNSGFDVKITIRGSDMTGGITWALSDTPGPDTYGLRAGLDGVSYNITVMNTDNIILIGNLTDNSSQQWGLELLSPTSFSDGVLKSGNVTLTATAI
jgi:hypothetical protein